MTATERPALELRIYPPIPPNPWPEGECMRRQSDPWWLSSVEWQHARDIEHDAWIAKTLPEACLAAEYWKAVWEYDARFPEDAPGWHWHHSGNDSEVVIEHEVLHRFAKLPHAASSDYQ